KPGKRIRVGSALCVRMDHHRFVNATVSGVTREGDRILEFQDPDVARSLATVGDAPLPPYIHAKLDDEERDQTVYGLVDGSAAAPTAGLHFTSDIITGCRNRGVSIAWTTLHVGIDTFRPVRTDELDSHVMHGEHFQFTDDNADIINSTRGRIIAV